MQYGGWPNCRRISNGTVELVLTGDVGPRIMRYAFVDGDNIFAELPEQLGRAGESLWQPRGGHRIWIAPELVPDTYALDNAPVRIDAGGDTVECVQPVEPETGLEKRIRVRLDASGCGVEVTHRIRNAGDKPRRFAPWALSMLAPGGVGITGFPPRGTHPENLPPTNPLVMWAFTDLSDSRWKFTRKYMLLGSDTSRRDPQKLGHFNQNTWGAYVLGDSLFVKRYRADPSRDYPDFGCSFEMFSNDRVLELETLGPLEDVGPGESIEHVEHWTLKRGVRVSKWTDDELDRLFGASERQPFAG